METLTSPHLARPATQEPRALVIHAHGDWLKSVQDGKFDFFKKLVRTATARGTTSRIVAADGAASRLLLGQDHMHILVGCPPSYGRGQLHALPGHVWGFWYLDEVGTFQHSSLRFARFCADTVDADRAAYFFNGVTSYMLRENVSNRPQEPRLDKPLDPAAATIFCQQNELGPERSHYLTTEQMIRVTARTCAEERVYVKPYPDQTKLARKALIDLVADYPTYEDKSFWRVPTMYASIQKNDFSQEYPMILTSGRLVEYEGGGDESRSNPWLAELQQDMFVEVNPRDANNIGIRDGAQVWVEGPEGAKVKVMAMVTERVGEGVAFMPFHFGGHYQGEDQRSKYPDGADPYVLGESTNVAQTYGYDSVTQMQETKATLCKIMPA